MLLHPCHLRPNFRKFNVCFVKYNQYWHVKYFLKICIIDYAVQQGNKGITLQWNQKGHKKCHTNDKHHNQKKRWWRKNMTGTSLIYYMTYESHLEELNWIFPLTHKSIQKLDSRFNTVKQGNTFMPWVETKGPTKWQLRHSTGNYFEIFISLS